MQDDLSFFHHPTGSLLRAQAAVEPERFRLADEQVRFFHEHVPGSHRWNLLPITGLAGDMEAIAKVLTTEQCEQFVPVAIELGRGEATFHHPLMVHGSLANVSD